MQAQHIKLNEIIWEITGECHNGCAYCGSKEITSSKTDEEFIKEIVDNIYDYIGQL